MLIGSFLPKSYLMLLGLGLIEMSIDSWYGMPSCETDEHTLEKVICLTEGNA